MFNCQVSQSEAGDVVITLSGVLDESANLSANEVPDGVDVIFDFSDLTGINSNGIRLWIAFIQNFQKRSGGIRFQKCRIPFIDQATVLPNLIPKGVVVDSFFTPYFCDECETETEILIDVSLVNDAGFGKKVCDQCGLEMTVDDFGHEYLEFVLALKEQE